MRDLRRENLKGTDRPVGEVSVGDVEVLRLEQTLAGIPARFNVGTEAAGRDRVADDASAVQDGVGGRLAFFGPDQKSDGVAADGKAVSKFPRYHARASGLILKDEICEKENIHKLKHLLFGFTWTRVWIHMDALVPGVCLTCPKNEE